MTNQRKPKFFYQWQNPKADFADNRERFRLFNSMHKVPSRLMFILLSIISLVLSTVPLVWPGAHFSTSAWFFWGFGLGVSVGFENGANLHYMLYSKIANEQRVGAIKLNICINKTMRIVSMLSWIMTTIALAMMVITKSSSFYSLW